MKILIVEDDALAADFIEKLIQDNFEDFAIVGKAASAKTAAKLYDLTKPDLLIMDINLGDHTSFDLFGYIDPLGLNIIFTSSYDEFALKAIKVDAVDYLMKPIKIGDFKVAIKKVVEKIERNKILDTSIKSIKRGITEFGDRLLIFTDQKLIPVEVSSIIKFKSKGAYTDIFMTDGKIFCTSKNLGQYDSFLENRNFLRIHESCLINIVHIMKYHPGENALVELVDSSLEKVAKLRKRELLKKFGR